MKSIIVMLFLAVCICGYAEDEQTPSKKMHAFEMEDGNIVEVRSYFLIGDSYTVTLPDGKTINISKKDVRSILKKQANSGAAQISPKEFDEVTAKNEVAFQTLRERMADAHTKRKAIRIPTFQQRTVTSNGGGIVSVENSIEIVEAKASYKKCVDEILLSNKLLLTALKSQSSLDYAIHKQRTPEEPVLEPQLPELTFTAAAAPNFITVEGAVSLNTLTEMAKDARHHWLLATTKGGTFDGKYIPAIDLPHV